MPFSNPSSAGAKGGSRRSRATPRCWLLRLLGGLTAFAFLLIIVGAGAAALYLMQLRSELPDLSRIANYRPPLITEIYAADGTVAAEFFNERRRLVPMERMPAVVIRAFLAAEDADFYRHKGVNPLAIARAALANLREGRIVQGGSTITQQITKSLLLSSEKTYRRKLKEALLAVEIEEKLTKDEILYMYLNQIFFGHRAYGVASACEVYFGKPLERITLAEAALLAGLPQAPSLHNPITNPEQAVRRRNYVLDRMRELGMIDAEAHRAASSAELRVVGYTNPATVVAPYYTEAVRRMLEERYGKDRLYNGGLQVDTPLDPAQDRAAAQALRRGLIEHDRRQGWQGALRNEPEAIAQVWLDRQTAALRPSACGRPECPPVPETVDSLIASDAKGRYPAWVEAVSSDSKGLIVRLGPYRAVLPYEEIRWAGPRHAEKLDHTLYSPARNFKIGDVIGVAVLAIEEPPPEEGGTTLPPRLRLTLDQRPLTQGAVLAMDPHTREVSAMVGGYDHDQTQFNRALQARRQPGSAFKPFIYAAAYAHGYTAASLMADSPIVYEDVDTGRRWKPKNYSGEFTGVTTLRKALAESNNLIAIKLLKAVGISDTIALARRFGIESELSADLSLGLGSSGLSLLEMVNAYAVFADAGRYADPVFIREVRDRDGHVLERRTATPRPSVVAPEWADLLRQARTEEGLSATGRAVDKDRPIGGGISPQLAFLMTYGLRHVVEEGTGQRVKALGRPIAGKTGTTNGMSDAWFIGYTPDLVAGVWVGYDDTTQPLGKQETGGRVAAPIFLYFMEQALLGQPVKDFIPPSGIVFEKIDGRYGTLAGPETEEPYFEAFGVGLQPTEGPPRVAAPERIRKQEALGY